MLFKNGATYQMTQADKEDLRKRFNFPIRLVYPPELIKFSRLNRLPDKPQSIGLPMRVVIRNKDGETQEWRWARDTTIDGANKTKYFPRRINFTGNIVIPETELELLYFLFWKSPHCKNGGLEEKQRRKVYFMIEDLVKIAEGRVAMKATVARYEVMVYDKELGLPEHRLRALAKAYFIPRVDDLHLDQVRVAIDHEVKRDAHNGIQNFIEMSNSDEYIQLRSKMQVAIDREIIIFIPRDRVWAWKGDEKVGQKERHEDICRVLSKANPKQALIDYYEGDLDFKQRLNNEMDQLTAMEPKDRKVSVPSTTEEVDLDGID